MSPLADHHLHLMRLIERDQNEEGWTSIAPGIEAFVRRDMDKELYALRDGHIRLTGVGRRILRAERLLQDWGRKHVASSE